MIRLATPNDVPAMVRMGEAFHALAVSGHYIPWCGRSFALTLAKLIVAGSAFVYEVDGQVEGMTAAVLQPAYFNDQILTCNELFCWVNPTQRGAGMNLFDMLESWAKQKGAKVMVLATVPNMRSEVLDRKYRAKGYALTDNFYMKVL